jgi:hypothetical protein
LLPADIRNDERRYTAYLEDCTWTFSTLLYKFMSGKEVDSSFEPEKRQRFIFGGRRKLTCRRKKCLSHKRPQKRRNSCFSRRNKKSRK